MHNTLIGDSRNRPFRWLAAWIGSVLNMEEGRKMIVSLESCQRKQPSLRVWVNQKVDSVSKVFISFLNCVFKCKSAKRSLPELIEAFTGVGWLLGDCGSFRQKQIGISLSNIWWDTVCRLEEDWCGSDRKLNPVVSGWSYIVNVHGFCCHRWGGWGRQM